jgi:hypothetical protein
MAAFGRYRNLETLKFSILMGSTLYNKQHFCVYCLELQELAIDVAVEMYQISFVILPVTNL